MKITLSRDLFADLDAGEAPATTPRPRPGVQCLCGRFAKYLGSQSYYNGNYNCYRYTVRCSRCGDVDVECV